MQMSPNHLTPQMQKAFLLLQVLPLQAFISSDIPFVLSTPKEKQIRETELMAVDLLNLGPMPDRVRNKRLVLILLISLWTITGGVADNQPPVRINPPNSDISPQK